LGVGQGGGRIFSFFLCSQYVPLKFPMCSPIVFPIASRFNPICFAQSPPFLTLYTWAKGEGTPSFRRIFYCGEPPQFRFYFHGPIKLAHCKKQKVGLVRHPQLITMELNKYLHNRYNVLCRRGISWGTKMVAMSWLNIHPIEFIFFPFGEGAGGEAWGWNFLMWVFQWCSNDVPEILNAFLKGVPNSTSFYPISFAQSCPLLFLGGAFQVSSFFGINGE
jgi:hypothetical protein